MGWLSWAPRGGGSPTLRDGAVGRGAAAAGTGDVPPPLGRRGGGRRGGGACPAARGGAGAPGSRHEPREDGGGGIDERPSSLRETLPSVTALEMLIMCPHLRHFIRTDLPATFSSAIWYFALQLGQRNFIQREGQTEVRQQDSALGGPARKRKFQGAKVRANQATFRQ